MIVDTHVHYNLPPLSDNWRNYWLESRGAGVHGAIIVGTTIETSKKALELANDGRFLYASVGVHPTEDVSTSQIPSLEEELEDLIASGNPTLVAIGECGLDYYRLPEEEAVRSKAITLQKKVFGMQCSLAQRHNLPLIIHCRDAYDDMLDAIDHFSTAGATPKMVLHCMSGPLSYLKKALEKGCYIGFAGNVTYPKAKDIQELAKNTPKDRMLLETDAPFLPPQSHRGDTNHPQNIMETAEFLGKLLSVKVPDLAAQTASNAEQLFGPSF